jgi:hypothetical protein
MRSLCLGVCLVALSSLTSRGQWLNITADGTPIIGVSNGNIAQTGNEGYQVEPGQDGVEPPTYMVDGSVSTGDQTFGDVAYAGILGMGLQAPSSQYAVTDVAVNFEIFFDGGWFGLNHEDALPVELAATNNMTQAPLTATDLSVLPTLQITTDGVNWTNVAYTSNYVSQLEGIYHYNEAISPVVTFVLDTPQSDIEGIRLIGETGGTSDFLGVSNFAVLAPEPSSYALIGCGLGCLVLLARLRRLAC